MMRSNTPNLVLERVHRHHSAELRQQVRINHLQFAEARAPHLPPACSGHMGGHVHSSADRLVRHADEMLTCPAAARDCNTRVQVGPPDHMFALFRLPLPSLLCIFF